MNAADVRRIADSIASGSIAIIPTDTAYGLAADARNARAIAAVKRLKRRAGTKPIAVIAADLAQVRGFFRLPKRALALARRHWPGPLTILLKPRARRLATRALSSNGWVGVRVPAREVARQICARVGAPLTATSANRTGAPECYTVITAMRSLRRSLPALDVGPLRHRRPSTVVRVTETSLAVLRPGPVRPGF